MAYPERPIYPIEVVSLTLPTPKRTGYCPFCQIELERDFFLNQTFVFCSSCDFSQPENGG